LLCRALDLRVPDWTTKSFNTELHLEDVGARPSRIVVARRLGIPKGRDEHLMYRFVDYDHLRSATQNPMPRSAVEGVDYLVRKARG
ncbi:MAG: 3-methyladenine DNA glycosylase, partial [Deltaproteobacteria bacterium]